MGIVLKSRPMCGLTIAQLHQKEEYFDIEREDIEIHPRANIAFWAPTPNILWYQSTARGKIVEENKYPDILPFFGHQMTLHFQHEMEEEISPTQLQHKSSL